MGLESVPKRPTLENFLHSIQPTTLVSPHHAIESSIVEDTTGPIVKDLHWSTRNSGWFGFLPMTATIIKSLCKTCGNSIRIRYDSCHVSFDILGTQWELIS